MPTELLDARGYPRASGTLPGAHAGRPPANKGRTYPADAPKIGEIVAVLAALPETPHGRRLRALIVLLWRSGLRISEALALELVDLDDPAIVVRRGKGGKRRVVGMDPWAWEQLRPWLRERDDYPHGPVFCVLSGPTAGRAMHPSQVRLEMRRAATAAGVRRRFAPHQLRHGMAVDWMHEHKDVYLLQRQLGHSHLGVTTRYLSSVSVDEVLDASSDRPAPVMPVPDLMSAFRGR